MRDPRAIALHLAAWAREERAGQRDALALLDEQRAAAQARDLTRVEASAADLRRLAERAAPRARRCEGLLRELSALWQVPAAVLTLGSVAERLGADGTELVALRRELRAGAAEVLQATRKVGALVNAFRRIAGEVVEILLTDEDGTPLHHGGALIDAEA